MDSPLVKIKNLDMIQNFPLEYMHLVCLGVVKRIISYWVEGPLLLRLLKKIIYKISTRILSFAKIFPSDFSHKPRTLKEFKYFKATKFRSFLLYSGVC